MASLQDNCICNNFDLYGVDVVVDRFRQKVSDFWIPPSHQQRGTAQDLQSRPSLVLESISMNICMQAHTFKIYAKHIDCVLIPNNPSIFAADEGTSNDKNKNMGAYGQFLNVLFICLRYEPVLISLFVDANVLHHLYDSMRVAFDRTLCHKCHVIDNAAKQDFLSTISFPVDVEQQWTIINQQKLAELKSLISVEHNCNDCKNESDTESALSSDLCDADVVLTDTKVLKFERNTSIEFQWRFAAQYGHKEQIFVLQSSHRAKIQNGEWLNDDIVDFGMKYIYDSWPDSMKKRCYVFNVFLYGTLRSILLRKQQVTTSDITLIKRKTKNFTNIFDREFIIVPIQEHNHWTLMIIAQRTSAGGHFHHMYILDSLNPRDFKKIHWRKLHVFTLWLQIQACRDRRVDPRLFMINRIKYSMIKVPQQPNLIDCGCFLLQNLRHFGKNAATIHANKSVRWYSPKEGVMFRSKLIQLFDTLHRSRIDKV